MELSNCNNGFFPIVLTIVALAVISVSGENPPQLWSDNGGGVDDDDDLSFLREGGLSDRDGEGRVLWTGRGKSSSCRGSVTKLRRDEATVVRSHRGYGQEPYPDDYHCRWLFIPEGCDLGVDCDMGTRRNLRRSRNSFGR